MLPEFESQLLSFSMFFTSTSWGLQDVECASTVKNCFDEQRIDSKYDLDASLLEARSPNNNRSHPLVGVVVTYVCTKSAARIAIPTVSEHT